MLQWFAFFGIFLSQSFHICQFTNSCSMHLLDRLQNYVICVMSLWDMHSLLEKVFPLHLSVKRINMQLREYGYIRFALIIFFFWNVGHSWLVLGTRGTFARDFLMMRCTSICAYDSLMLWKDDCLFGLICILVMHMSVSFEFLSLCKWCNRKD